jgi:hypothetical protein
LRTASTPRSLIGAALAIGSFIAAPPARAHSGHAAATYRVSESIEPGPGQHQLQLSVTDEQTGEPAAARFTLTVDGRPWVPAHLGEHGLRFESIHRGKSESAVVTYARGTGTVAIPLPAGAKQGTVRVARGLAYLPEAASFAVAGPISESAIRIRRWSEIQRDGWLPADAHVHYDRTAPEHDRDWLTMLEADGLTHAHFLVLAGVNLPGVWAKQYAYGETGQAFDGKRLIRSGEEVRDPQQGHISLLGIDRVILPISTGGIGEPPVPFHYPPFYQVLQQARQAGGIGGPAHGGGAGRNPTVFLDAILGGVDFIEIANTPAYQLDAWYQLMNCGFHLPPTGGSDLPNYSTRDPWQPFLGETRVFARVGEQRDHASWVQALRRGEVFVSSGPLIELSIDGVGVGGTLRLPAGGGEIELSASLASPRRLQTLELIQNGEVLIREEHASKHGAVHEIRASARIRVTQSSWFAARGAGSPKQALQRDGHRTNAFAHTAAIRVLVGDQRIAFPRSAAAITRLLRRQREFYRTQGRFEQAEHRARFVELYDRAISRLQSQTAQD